MLREPTVRLSRPASLVRRARTAKLGLRVSLALLAVVYIVAPTALQWMSLEGDRVAARAELAASDLATDRTGHPNGVPAAVLDVDADSTAWRDLIPAGVAALTGSRGGASLAFGTGATLAIRTFAVLAAAGIAVVVGARLGRPYRPRHARRGGFARVFV